MFCLAIAFPATLSNRLGFYYLVCDFEGRISFASPRVQNLPAPIAHCSCVLRWRTGFVDHVPRLTTRSRIQGKLPSGGGRLRLG